jgi:hypothetical protein
MSEAASRPSVSAPGDVRQPAMTDAALAAGLDALGRALALRHPGWRFLFETRPRDDRARLVAPRQIAGALAVPEDAHAALVDGNGLRSPRPTDVAHEHAVDHRP